MKKSNEVNTKTTSATKIEELMKKYPNVSLRRLARETEVSYPVLLKRSKQPIEGQIYDPNATNYTALQEVFDKKGIDLTEVDWERLNQEATRKGGTLPKDISEFTVGKEVYIRRNNETPYVVVYTTETHVVIQLKGTQEPIVWSWSTFLINGPQFEPRAPKNTKVDEVDEVERD